MAQTTPNFGFNIAEGTDTVNLLTQCYPNFSSLDSILQAIKETGVTTAVATKTGTNFAVVRTDTDCNFFRFIATANYAAGDTFTVDGVPVTATSPAGTALAAGAFVINQSVIGVVNSSVLTLFVGGGAANIDAADVDYDNSGSGLTATDVQAAIDEVLGDIPTGFAAAAITYDNSGSGLTATDAQAAIDELAAALPTSGSVTVTADGVKTYKQMLNSLWAAADLTKIGPNSKILEGDNTYDAIYNLSQKTSSNEFTFTRPAASSANTVITALSVTTATSARYNSVNGNITDNSNSVMPSGQHYTLLY